MELTNALRRIQSQFDAVSASTPFHCQFCPRKFSIPSFLNNHVELYHPANTIVVEDDDQQVENSVSEVAQDGERLNNFEEFAQDGERVNIFEELAKDDEYNKILQWVADSKPALFSCDSCDLKFKSLGYLESHVATVKRFGGHLVFNAKKRDYDCK